MTGKQHRIGLIRVLTTDDPDLLNAHGKLIENSIPGLVVISKCIPDQEKGIYSLETHRKAVPKILHMAKEMEKEGLAGVLISCAGDPGLAESKKALKIPVVGAGKALALTALMWGDKVGVLNLTEETPINIKEVLGKTLAAEESVDAENTVELMQPGEMKKVINSCLLLRDRGTEVIALACTGMSTIGASVEIKKHLGLKVIDPVIAEGIAMWSILNYSQ